jgi:predicted peptidase
MCILLLLISATAGAEQPAPKAGEQVAQSSPIVSTVDGNETTSTIRYWLSLPDAYKADGDKNWPLLLFLHGSGERGDDLELVKKHGPPKLIAAGEELPFVVVSPQCPQDLRWNAGQLAKLVDTLANTHRIDRRRMYVTGLSMGGSGTWALVEEFPGLFAAAMPICGRGNPTAGEILAKTPISIFVGAKDKADLVKNNEEMLVMLKKARGKAELTVYPDAGHDSWTATYSNPAVYKWLLSHQLPESP